MPLSVESLAASPVKPKPPQGLNAPEHSITDGRGFRPDVDGLRAVAIILVVLSHMGIQKASGGFVGVDIFFVISGYLLTGNIAHSIGSGRFSVGGFYERRIRRIFPALIVTLAVTSLFAYCVLPSQALLLYGKSLVAAIFSYSNIYFSTQPEGYFSVTYTKLLLHTWSLGVEEQFYLVLPLCMLWAARKPASTTRWVVGVFAVISFAIAAYLTFANEQLAFYMPYTRAWELLIGSALALRMVPCPSSRAVRETLAGLSVLTILFCMVRYSESTPFPGLAALPPCAAAAILILVGERGRTVAGSFLYWPPVVFVGAISYSLYLWHWPVILLLNLGIVPDVKAIHGLALLKVGISLALATLSWRYVEQPFRTGRFKRMPRKQIFGTAAIAAVAMSAVAAAFIAGHGLPGRFPGNANAAGNFIFHDETRKSKGCWVEPNYPVFDARACLTLEPGKANVLLFGDSHAYALWYALSRSMPDTNVLQATGSSCRPYMGGYDRTVCGSLRSLIYEKYLPQHHVSGIVLTEAWSSPADFDELVPALRWLHERRIPVTVVGPVPEYSGPLPMLLSFGERWRMPRLASHRLVRSIADLDSELRSKADASPGVRYASVWQALCGSGSCQEYADDRMSEPVLLDSNHLSDEGALVAVRRMQAGGQLPR